MRYSIVYQNLLPPWRVTTQEIDASSKTEVIKIFKQRHPRREYAEESIISINVKNEDNEDI